MKKILIIMLSIFLVVLTSCNMDASTGIFQSVLASQTIITEPISQIINIDPTNKLAYMVSQSGLMKFDANGYTTLLSYSDYPSISYTAFMDSSKENIYFRTTKAETDSNVTLNYYKYNIQNPKVDTLQSSEFLPSRYELNYVDNDGNIYLLSKTDKKVNKATLSKDKLVLGAEVLNFNDITAKYNGVEVRPNYISIASTNVENSITPTDYTYTNYFINNTGVAKKINNLPSYSKVSGIVKTKSGKIYATAYNSSTDASDYEIKIYSIDESTGDATLKISTGISAKDLDLTIGELNGKYFFHVYNKAALYYFDDSSTSISQTSMNNLSSSMDFVASYTDGTGAIIATSQNGFYRLTDVTSASGFNRYTSFN